MDRIERCRENLSRTQLGSLRQSRHMHNMKRVEETETQRQGTTDTVYAIQMLEANI